MNPYDLDYREIRARVDAQLEREKGRNAFGLFGAHLIMFITFMVMSWSIAGLQAPAEPVYNVLMMLSIGWLAGVTFHGATVYNQSRFGEKKARERLTAREIQRELARTGMTAAGEPASKEKAKRAMRLTEDGELLEIVNDEVEDARPARQRGH
jgi:hypothetical protein